MPFCDKIHLSTNTYQKTITIFMCELCVKMIPRKQNLIKYMQIYKTTKELDFSNSFIFSVARGGLEPPTS